MYYCDDLEIKAIERVLKTKKLFRYQGKDVETECSQFEKSFARYLNSKHSILLSSGTNALVNALFSLGITKGDEVLIPAYTFFATAAAVLELNATPVVVNIDQYLSFDSQDLQHKISDKTKALIAVHMDGYACNINSLTDFCQTHNIALIEDCAQAVGGQYQNKKLGSFGAFGCFSFNVDKIISCGEGGALSVNDEELYQKAFLYHDTCNQFGATHKDLYSIAKFSGKSMRASEIQGAMMNVQLDRLDTIIADLKIRKDFLDHRFSELGFEHIPVYDKNGECFTTTRLLCKDAAAVNAMVISLNNLGIKTNSPMLRPAHHIWQWHALLPKTQHKFDFLPTIDILSRVLLVHVTLDETIEEWQEKLKRIHA
nr:aminotransferase class I/II-fold pyridoxal phosphate-dependent enzyme [Bacteriovorax sp. HI3]